MDAASPIHAAGRSPFHRLPQILTVLIATIALTTPDAFSQRRGGGGFRGGSIGGGRGSFGGSRIGGSRGFSGGRFGGSSVPRTRSFSGGRSGSFNPTFGHSGAFRRGSSGSIHHNSGFGRGFAGGISRNGGICRTGSGYWGRGWTGGARGGWCGVRSSYCAPRFYGCGSFGRSVFACGAWPTWCGPRSCFLGSSIFSYGVYGGAAYVDYPYLVDNSVYVAPTVVETEAPPPPVQDQSEPVQSESGRIDSRVAGLLEQGEKALQKGQYDVAREHFDRAMQLAPDDPRSRISFGLTEFALGNFGDAAAAIHDAMSMAPDLAATPLDLRKGFGDGQTYQSQMNLLENLIHLRPDDLRFPMLLGFMQYYGGQRATGIQTLRNYTKARPDDATVNTFVETAARASQPQTPAQPSTPPKVVYPKKSASLVEPLGRHPDGPIASWDDVALQRLAIDEFSMARGLDRVGNRLEAEIASRDVDDETGALEKAKLKMHWVEWKKKTGHDGFESMSGKQKKTTVKIKFDEWGQFSEFDD